MMVICLDIDNTGAEANSDERDKRRGFQGGLGVNRACGAAPPTAETVPEALEGEGGVFASELLLGVCDRVEGMGVIDDKGLAELALGGLPPPADLEHELLDRDGTVGDCVAEGVDYDTASERVYVQGGDDYMEGAARGAICEKGEYIAEKAWEQKGY